jgi:CheY-like chemotaxis protein
MQHPTKQITILMADDDEDDRLLVYEALKICRFANRLHCVEDGEELMDYLCRRGDYVEPSSAPRPDLILLDLNMPKKDGREVLEEIKTNPTLRCIPIIVLTTSSTEDDIRYSYELGANSYITKPALFDSLVEMVQVLGKYWFEVVELPSR